jgi:hypothetical protein
LIIGQITGRFICRFIRLVLTQTVQLALSSRPRKAA